MAKAVIEPGMTIDGFRIGEPLNSGGMAALWHVARGDVAGPAVMKTPFLHSSSNLSDLVGFTVEQAIMSRLSGSHVPRFIAAGEITEQPYIVMELVSGQSLEASFAPGFVPLDEVVARGAAIADALADLHRQHVIHLDLKPANILFRETGEAVLVDFGLSRHQEHPDLLAEQYRKPMGTVEYMAPEQIAFIRSDPRTDLYALGAILYRMATNMLPFEASGGPSVVRNRLWRDPLPPRKIRPEISPALQETILKCLEPLPDRRYATAEEIAFDLRNPDLVELTERAARTSTADYATMFQRWLRAKETMREITASARKPPPRDPIVLVAVDLRPGLDALRDDVLEAAASVLANMPGARLACLAVMQKSLLGGEDNVDAAGNNVHVERLKALRAFAAPLELPPGKGTFHLVEARSLAAGIVAFARANKVDHIVIGAPPGNGAASRATMQIALEVPAAVTIVRPGGSTDVAPG